MNILVTDRRSIEQGIRVRSSYVVISIHDPNRPRPRVRKQSGLRDILHLAFHDTEPSERMRLPEGITMMTPDHARQIWAFVHQHRQTVGAIVVHCEQGMSRSPAVAAALCKGLGLAEDRFWREHQPNIYVYRLVLEASSTEAVAEPNTDARGEGLR